MDGARVWLYPHPNKKSEDMELEAYGDQLRALLLGVRNKNIRGRAEE